MGLAVFKLVSVFYLSKVIDDWLKITVVEKHCGNSGKEQFR